MIWTQTENADSHEVLNSAASSDVVVAGSSTGVGQEDQEGTVMEWRQVNSEVERMDEDVISDSESLVEASQLVAGDMHTQLSRNNQHPLVNPSSLSPLSIC